MIRLFQRCKRLRYAPRFFSSNGGNTEKVDQSVSVETLLAHTGMEVGHNAAMAPPLHVSTTYTRPADGNYLESDFIYARMENPTRLLLEQSMSRLECHGDHRPYNPEEAVSCAFASGMAAASSVVLAHQSPVTIFLPMDVYHGVPSMLEDVMSRFDVTRKAIDFNNLTMLEDILLDASSKGSSDIILWMESPSNPQCHVIDVESVCKVVERLGLEKTVTTVVDSTFAPPCISQPLRLGADMVLHSATKCLGGHSDALIGIVTASPWTERGRELGPLLKQVRIMVGAVASPFDTWLTIRGMRTLHVRMERQSTTALALAELLHNHPFVPVVHYPGLASHPQHEVARKQMVGGFGCVLSLELADEKKAIAVAAALQTVQRATSLGGTESLVEHRASIEPEGRVVSPPGLLRVSVGLEDPQDIIEDFQNALRIAQQDS